MEANIFHTVNSGLYLYKDNAGYLIDGIHRGAAEGFSPMPEETFGQMSRREGVFTCIDVMLFTHFHGDHFDLPLLQQALSAEYRTLLYGPQFELNSISPEMLSNGLYHMRPGAGELWAADTLHDGGMFRDDIHQSFMLRLGGEIFFIAGDAKLEEKDIETFQIFTGQITAGFFNLYQISSHCGLEFIRKMKPGRVFVYHMPFEADDRYNYYKLLPQILRRYPKDLPIPEVVRQMSWIDNKKPEWVYPWAYFVIHNDHITRNLVEK